jgi:hypothetical protein
LHAPPGWHRDTYVEEYHLAFLQNLARGKKLEDCGIADVHIGGLATVPALFAALHSGGEDFVAIVRRHVSLTHNCPEVIEAAMAFARILLALETGCGLREAILTHATGWVGERKFLQWSKEPDEVVIGQRLSPGVLHQGCISRCTLPQLEVRQRLLLGNHRKHTLRRRQLPPGSGGWITPRLGKRNPIAMA